MVRLAQKQSNGNNLLSAIFELWSVEKVKKENQVNESKLDFPA